MRFRRGFFRLWVVFAAIYAAIALIFILERASRFDAAAWFDAFLAVVIPPAIVLAIGSGLAWAFSGFRRDA